MGGPTGDGLEEITALVKRRWETGEFGDAHFRVVRPILDRMRALAPAPEPDLRLGSPLGDLMGIPVVIDDELPDGVWRLVVTGTRAVLFEGVVR